MGEDRSSHSPATRGDITGSSDSDSDESGDLLLDEDDDDSGVFEESKHVGRSSKVTKAEKNQHRAKAKHKQRQQRTKRLAKTSTNDDIGDVNSVSADATATLKLLAQSRDLLLETHSGKRHGKKAKNGKSSSSGSAPRASRKKSHGTSSRRDRIPRSSNSSNAGSGGVGFQSKLLLKVRYGRLCGTHTHTEFHWVSSTIFQCRVCCLACM